MNARTQDRLMAVLTLSVLAIFLAVLIHRVPRLDLTCVIAAAFLLVVYDFFISPSRAGRK